MIKELSRFLFHSRSWGYQSLVWLAGMYTGLAVYGLWGYQYLVWKDLFVPTRGMAGFVFGGGLLFYLVWLVYSMGTARWLRVCVADTLRKDAWTCLGCAPLMGLWLKHFDIPVSSVFIFSGALIFSWKIWNIPVDRSVRIGEPSCKMGFRVVLGLTSAYVGVFGFLSAMRVMALQTYGDFAAILQAIWGFGHGRALFVTHLGNSIWGGHFWPTLMILGPFYRLYEHPATLAVLQSVILGAGAIPVYLIARDKLQSVILGIVLVIAYLLYPALQISNLGDFHETLLAPPLLLFTIYFIESGRYRAASALALLTLGCKEDMPIPVFMIGLYILMIKRRYAIGAAYCIGSALWFYIVVFKVIPYFAHGDAYMYVQASPLTRDGAETLWQSLNGLWSQIVTISRGVTLTELLLPLGFAPLLAPFAAFMGAAPLGELFVYTGPPFGLVGTIYTWHIATVIPFVFFAGIEGIRWAQKKMTRSMRSTVTLGTMITLCAIGSNMSFGALPFRRDFNWEPYQMTEHARIGHDVLRLIPPDVPVTATAELGAHLSHREEIYEFPNPFIRSNWFSETRKPVTPVYVIVDTSMSALSRMENPQIFLEMVREVGQRPDYETYIARDGFVLLRLRQ